MNLRLFSLLYILWKFFDGIIFWNYARIKTKWFTRKAFSTLNAVNHKAFLKIFLFFKIRYKKIRIFKSNFQKLILFVSLGLLRPRCFSEGTSTILRFSPNAWFNDRDVREKQLKGNFPHVKNSFSSDRW